MARRSYTKREKLTAVLAADMTTQEAAATAAGVPRTTLRRWLEDPDLAELRHNARESMAEELAVLARLALLKLTEKVLSGEVEPRDLITALGVATDKSQLLAGHATSRTETLSQGMNDDERRKFRDFIDGLKVAEPAGDTEGGVPLGVGAEVRQ